MKKIIFLSIFLSALAQDFTKSAFPLLRMGHSAYSLAMGNASVAAKPNSASYFSNPATLADKQNDFFSMNVQILSLDRRVYSFSYNRSRRKRTFFSIAWIHAKVNDLYNFSREAEKGSEIDYGDNLFLAAAGVRFSDHFAASLSVKYLSQSISNTSLKDYSATVVAIDLSALYKLNTDLEFAFSIRDLARGISTNSEAIFEAEHRESLAKSVIIGFKSKQFSDILSFAKIQLLVDYRFLEDYKNTLHLGLETRFSDSFSLRFGLDDMELRAGFGLAFLIAKQKITMDYAFLPSSIDAGSSHVLSWMISL